MGPLIGTEDYLDQTSLGTLQWRWAVPQQICRLTPHRLLRDSPAVSLRGKPVMPPSPLA
jgi:hypothetical protein